MAKLLDLPPSIRKQIFRYAGLLRKGSFISPIMESMILPPEPLSTARLTPPYGISNGPIYPNAQDFLTLNIEIPRQTLSVQLLRVSKRVREEAMEIFFGENVVMVHVHHPRDRNWPRNLSNDSLASIRSMYIVFAYSELSAHDVDFCDLWDICCFLHTKLAPYKVSLWTSTSGCSKISKRTLRRISSLFTTSHRLPS